MECDRCGSTNVRWIQSNSLERILRVFTGKMRFVCKRCGWSGLGVCDETAMSEHALGNAKGGRVEQNTSSLKLVGVSAHAYRAEFDSRA